MYTLWRNLENLISLGIFVLKKSGNFYRILFIGIERILKK